ncbi:MAG: hypothetical protein IAG10_34540 [Planctomycetaceae bacterium]|nr:hypothetical protein [Planctomycetaceae bacterium]
MRKNFEIWATVVAILLLLQQVSLAQSKKTTWKSNSTRAERKSTRLQAPDAEAREPNLELDPFTVDEDVDRIRLTGADDPLMLPPEPADSDMSSQTACCEKCWEFWEHRNAVWGEFLYLRPRGADVIYATPVDGTLSTSVPVGPQAVAAFGYDAGFRIGGAHAIDSCSSFTTNYMWYQVGTSDSVSLAGGGSFLRADTVHPGTLNVANDSLAAQTQYDLNLQAIDLNYKSILWASDSYVVNYLVGVKYARLEQQFGAAYSIIGDTTVDTNVDFDGVGPRFGFEGEKSLEDYGLLVYSKGTVNFLVGSCSADYLQTNIFSGIQAQTGLQETRIVTVPEFELGGGWQSCNGRFRITAGYYLAAWFNMMTTPEYLSTVRDAPNSFERQVKTLTLDGLNVRAEWRF